MWLFPKRPNKQTEQQMSKLFMEVMLIFDGPILRDQLEFNFSTIELQDKKVREKIKSHIIELINLYDLGELDGEEGVQILYLMELK